MSRKKRILVFFCVYEAEKDFAAATVAQLIDVWGHHELTVHILDDASPSQIGQTLVQEFAEQAHFRLTRVERSLGYHGLYERYFSFLHDAAVGGEQFDYVLRVDADVHLASRRLAALFDPGRLPETGIIGNTLIMRRRDFLLWSADLTPAGMRRRLCADGRMEHEWELRRTYPVWWSDIGWAALRRGFRGRIVAGALQVLTWRTLIAIRNRGWLERTRQHTGLIFQDDVLMSTMVHALGHRVVDLREVFHGWNAELFLPVGTPIDVIRSRDLDLLHPLKNTAWAREVRAALPLSAPAAANSGVGCSAAGQEARKAAVLRVGG